MEQFKKLSRTAMKNINGGDDTQFQNGHCNVICNNGLDNTPITIGDCNTDSIGDACGFANIANSMCACG
jgi:hypothetical protein